MTTIQLRTSSRDRFAQDLMNRGYTATMHVVSPTHSQLTTTADESEVREVARCAGVTCALVS